MNYWQYTPPTNPATPAPQIPSPAFTPTSIPSGPSIGQQPPPPYSPATPSSNPLIPSPSPVMQPNPVATPTQQGKALPKINPSQIPSPTTIPINTFITYNTQSGNAPPPTTSQFVVVDEGNASPRFIRSSLYQVPLNSDLAQKLSIPLGLVIQPMAEVGPGEVFQIIEYNKQQKKTDWMHAP